MQIPPVPAALRSLVLAFFVATSLSHARADAIITNPNPGGAGIGFPAAPATFGYDFTVGAAPLSITALGVWDQNQDGFTNSHTIGLWDSSQNLLATAVVSPGTVNTLIGQFRYVNLLVPVTLLPGMTYVLGASYITNDADRSVNNFSGPQATFAPQVISGNYRAVVGPGFAYPTTNLGPGSIVGPNAIFVVVPEASPGVLVFLLTAAGLLAFSARLRRVRF